MVAGLATIRRRYDESARRQRIGVVALQVVRAADESFPVVPVADREFAGSALLARSDESPLPDGGAIGCDAVGRGSAAIRVLDHRGAALRTILLGALDDAHLRQRMRVPAGRIAVATEEAGSPPRSDDREVAFLAHVALADVVLLPERGLDLLANRLAVGLQRLEDLAEHLLGFPDDVLAGPDACRNALHVRFEVRRHLRLRNPFGMVFEGLDHRARSEERRVGKEG